MFRNMFYFENMNKEKNHSKHFKIKFICCDSSPFPQIFNLINRLMFDFILFVKFSFIFNYLRSDLK